jgi:hypothetical protein
VNILTGGFADCGFFDFSSCLDEIGMKQQTKQWLFHSFFNALHPIRRYAYAACGRIATDFHELQADA